MHSLRLSEGCLSLPLLVSLELRRERSYSSSTTLRYQNFDRDSATLRSRVLKDRLISVRELFLRKFGGTCIWKYQMPWRDLTRYEGLKTVIVSHLCISPAKYNDYLHNKL